MRKADDVLRQLGITEPEDIDLEVIALNEGIISIEYEPLTNCEANIIGIGDDAIITVNATSSQARQRFSIAHELGHWIYDKGKAQFSCGRADMTQSKANSKETRANKFAAELLMPKLMFKQYYQGKNINFKTVNYLANAFDTSITSTAIRLIELSGYPSILISYSQSGVREWFFRQEDVPSVFFPNNKMPSDISNNGVIEVDLDKWFDIKGAEDYTVIEANLNNGFSKLVLLTWNDESQLLDFDEE